MPQELDSIKGSAFARCENLVNVDFPEGLKSIGAFAFNVCKSLAAVAFPDGLEKIEYGAFSACSSLTSLVFPEGLTEIGDRAFLYCNNLDSLSFPASMKIINWSVFCQNSAWNTDQDKTCNHIRYVNVKDLLTWVNSEREYKDGPYDHHLRVPHAQLYLDGTLLKEAVIPEGVEEIKPYTFYGLDSLTSVKLPSSLRSIGDLCFLFM